MAVPFIFGLSGFFQMVYHILGLSVHQFLAGPSLIPLLNLYENDQCHISELIQFLHGVMEKVRNDVVHLAHKSVWLENKQTNKKHAYNSL